eukprot:GSChrysophyteH1.ASY1.ANO1.1386.1 assembled CDS
MLKFFSAGFRDLAKSSSTNRKTRLVKSQLAFFSSYSPSKAENKSNPVKKVHQSTSGRADAALNVPDLIEHWSPDTFKKVGAAATAGGVLLTAAIGICQESMLVDALVAAYWYKGYQDLNQKSHTILRNFPVLGNFRFMMEMIRPEIRQYLIESDQDGTPYDRDHRAVVYQRAKSVVDTIPFGTRRNVYSPGYEWANHSIRVTIGNKDCKKPYSASLLNISAMSYGALSDNAILALSTAAKIGDFYHNTGEGGISAFHRQGGGDLVWNVGTGYFGCRNEDDPQVKMIEIKLSQGAKPGHGGLLPGAKVTKLIADARGVKPGVDCHSPPLHSAFDDAHGLIKFMCVGRPEEFAMIVQAMLELDVYPDFITIDGGEGGTGAAPPEFSNSIGTPLVEGLSFANQILLAAGVRHHIKIIASGKALKCNTNRCPTGITTQDPELQKGLDVNSKKYRVQQYHDETVRAAIDICQAIGVSHPSVLRPHHINKRISMKETVLYDDLFPRPIKGSLFAEGGPVDHQGKQMTHLTSAWTRATGGAAYS